MELSTIPAFVVFVIIMIYLVHLMENSLIKTRMDFMINIGLPFITFFPASLLICAEVLYHRKIHEPLKNHMKRLTFEFLVLLLGGTLWFGFALGLQPFFSPVFGDRDFIVENLLTLLVFLAIFAMLAKKFKETLQDLYPVESL